MTYDVYGHWVPGHFKSEVDELDVAHPNAPQAHPETNKGLRPKPQPLVFTGAEGQNRTADTGIFSPLLYRLSYLGTHR